jgi:hypothetical protein
MIRSNTISDSTDWYSIKLGEGMFILIPTKKNTEKSAHTALAVKACLMGGKTATLNAQ